MSAVPVSVHKKPSARRIQPMRLWGRLEAIRAPTSGKARKSPCPSTPPTERSTPQLSGTCAERASTTSGMLDTKIATERPCQPGGGASTHPTDPGAVSCSYRHDTTLQGYRLPSVTGSVTKRQFPDDIVTLAELSWSASRYESGVQIESETKVVVSYRASQPPSTGRM